MSTSAIKK